MDIGTRQREKSSRKKNGMTLKRFQKSLSLKEKLQRHLSRPSFYRWENWSNSKKKKKAILKKKNDYWCQARMMKNLYYNFKKTLKRLGHPKSEDQNGSILILSLWILALLSLMASSISFYATLQMKVVRHHMDQLRGRYLAQAGILWTMNFLTKVDRETYQSLSQEWSSNPEAFQERKLEHGRFSVSHTFFDSQLGSQTHFG